MRATARLVAVADGAGGTRLPVLRGEVPLLLRRTGSGPGPAVVHLVGGAAGPLAGDRLRLDIEVGPGADVCVRTVAASMALPGAADAWSRVEVRAVVADGGRLTWLPEPLIAARGCRHRADVRVELAAGAALAWRDELVCGRHGEEPGDVHASMAVDLDGAPLYHQSLTVGPAAPGWSGPAVLGGGRVAGSLLVVDAVRSGPVAPTTVGPGLAAAVLALAGPAVLVTAAGPDARTVRAYLDTALSTTGALATTGF